MKVLHTLFALSILMLTPGYALAQDATTSEDPRGDTWITCKKGKGNNEVIVNISDCNSLYGRLQAGFKCVGEGMFECGEDDLTCKERGGTCVSPQGEKCRGYLNGECQPPCRCSVGGGGGGGGRCDRDLAALEDCKGLHPGTLSCKDAPFLLSKICLAETTAANECCAGGGGGGSKCESDGTACKIRLCPVGEINVCIEGQSICCDPTSPGGGGGNSCDLTQKIYCDSNVLCPEGERLHRCDPGETAHCMGGIAYQCVETGGGGGGGMCDAPLKCAVLCEIGTTCVDCDGDGIGETCQ